MKKFTKLASVLLALALAVALAVPALAADRDPDPSPAPSTTPTTGTITVEDPVENATYTAYKIFDVALAGSGDSASYTYTYDATTEKAPLTAILDDYFNMQDVTGNATLKYITAKDDMKAADLAVALKAYFKDSTAGTAIATESGDNLTATLPLGYYFIDSTVGALCNLTTMNPNATIVDKNDTPFEKTAAVDGTAITNNSDVEVGTQITYTLTGEVPDTTGFDDYVYIITDKMDAGLHFDGIAPADFTVTVNGTALIRDTQYTVTTEKAAGEDFDFKVDIKVMELQAQKGQTIAVTYKATVTDAAVTTDPTTNTATLKYGHNDNTNFKEVTGSFNVFSTKIVINKYDGTTSATGAESKKLPGAEFILRQDVREAGAEQPVYKYYKYTAAKVEWVDDASQATVRTTLADGSAEFEGLKNGDYELVETKAPSGYNLLPNAVSVKIEGSVENGAVVNMSKNADVANNTGNVLPSTGGMGTTIFYAVGGVLVAAAAVLLITKKRMSAAQ